MVSKSHLVTDTDEIIFIVCEILIILLLFHTSILVKPEFHHNKGYPTGLGILLQNQAPVIKPLYVEMDKQNH